MLWINDADSRTLGFTVREVGEAWGAPERRREQIAIPGAAGVVPALSATQGPRVLRVRGTVTPTSLAARTTALDTLKAACAGVVELRFPDAPDRVCTASLVRATVTALGPAMWQPALDVECEFLAWDTTKRARTPSLRAIGATPTEIPLGSAPSTGVVTLYGSATNPTLTYRRHDGTALATMAFTVALTADDALELDLGLQTVTLSDAGVRSNGMALLTSGTFPVLDPADGDPIGGVWPTLEVSSGTGAVRYHQRWSW